MHVTTKLPLLIAVAVATVLPTAAAPCESLAAQALPDTTITASRTVAAGAFTLPNAQGDAQNYFKTLPAFCRIEATVKPTSDSDINIEIWLPIAGWNEKFQVVGNGGWAGSINYRSLGEALERGYASASTDTGHVGGDGKFAFEHPEKMIDYGYRSQHESTVKGKTLIQAYYGKTPRYTYWNGCSAGGRAGLIQAERYPQDFDGIIAGAPANPWTRLAAQVMWIAQAVLKDPASYIAKEKYPVIHKAVLDACDAVDGLKDGLIDDPRRCRFDPKVLECRGPETASCLTRAQVEAVAKIYTAPKNPRTGEEIYPGFVPGNELGWAVKAGGPEATEAQLDELRYVVFKNPNWDWRTFDFDRDVALADSADNHTTDAINLNLKPFLDHGKLLLYHGWADQNITPLATINYYNGVSEKLGGARKTQDSMRLFMAPGMGHCRGGEGPDTFDVVSAMEQWAEHGKAPEKMIASHSSKGNVDRTRPLCPYPQVAKYKGSGSSDDAANFVCKVP